MFGPATTFPSVNGVLEDSTTTPRVMICSPPLPSVAWISIWYWPLVTIEPESLFPSQTSVIPLEDVMATVPFEVLVNDGLITLEESWILPSGLLVGSST